MAFPDLHVPFHSEQALELSLAVAEHLKPEESVVLGDWMDCSLFSAHAKSRIPEALGHDFEEMEVTPVNNALDRIQKSTKGRTSFLEGNHEFRISRWCANQGNLAAALFHRLNPQRILSEGRKNFNFVPYSERGYNSYVQLIEPNEYQSGLVSVHGWHYNKAFAQSNLARSKSQSIITGHAHRSQMIVERDPWTGHKIKSFCPGALCELQPIYSHGGVPTDWVHGFSLIYVGSKSWSAYNVEIDGNSCVLPNGEEISL